MRFFKAWLNARRAAKLGRLYHTLEVLRTYERFLTEIHDAADVRRQWLKTVAKIVKLERKLQCYPSKSAEL